MKRATHCVLVIRPWIESRIHNANFLGAAFLSRLYHHTHEDEMKQDALASARYSAAGQQENGAWVYGERHTQKWVDNFHTGFNLMALKQIDAYVGEGRFKGNIERGYQFYLEKFFCNDGAPRYYSDRTYPIDIHSVSQSLITLSELQHLDDSSMEKAAQVFEWAMAHMRDPSGYFYFQKGQFYTKKISYMRWSQAWMALALATYSRALSGEIAAT